MPFEFRHSHAFLLALAAITSQACLASVLGQEVDFDNDIQPIFASRCLKCHGNADAEAGLRFTDRASATAVLDSGVRAIDLDDFDESELLRRVASKDADVRMPPHGPPLTEKQIDHLRRWIAAGAVWPAHWAYRPLVRPEPTVLKRGGQFATWPRTPIDRFILDKLLASGLEPSRPAEKRDLLRRVYFDLIGLPPTPDEIRSFEADESEEAYDRIVDLLLASPQYGERWTRHWMDVVHYAETHGHDQDRPREHAWPYRDYLIRSFNADKSYTRFVEEQIAGDVLFPLDPEAIVATGFLATGPWDESSLRDIREDTLDREIARYLDRDDIVTTVMSTFTSSTVHCARCHDHKFDPISQSDYYSLQAVFAATDKANRQYDRDPKVGARRRELQAAITALSESAKRLDKSLFAPELADAVAAWESEVGDAAKMWQTAQLIQFHSGGGAELKNVGDGSVLATGTRPDKDVYTLLVRPVHERITGIRLELLTDDSLPKTGPGRQDNGNLHLNEFRVWAIKDGDPASEVEVKFQKPSADFNQEGWSIELAIDGNPNSAWGIYPEVGKPHHAVFPMAKPLESNDANSLRVELHQVHGAGHLIGRLRVSTTDADGELSAQMDATSPAMAEILRTPRNQRTQEQQAQVAVFYSRQKWSSELASLPSLQMVYCGTNQFAADGSFRPVSSARPVHILNRGDIKQPLAEAQPGALGCLPELPAKLAIEVLEEEGQRRAALAKWMTDPKNVLVWRSIANRVWHYHFGRGIVDTPNDFGKMGGTPSHPALLDWLAVELRDNGGSLKALHRLIVTSAAYRQCTEHNPKFAAMDGDNRLLWRMNRRRLDAESIRDSVLFIAGTLDATMGGPSVKQFHQSPGVHVTPVVDYLNFDVADPANCRRSVYRFVFRTLPDPFMEALDCPDASQLTPERNTSLTALQALAMLNDKIIVRHSQHLAERIQHDRRELSAQVNEAYWMIFGRAPTPDEAALVEEYSAKHGLANACRFLFNSNEFLFVE